VRTADSGNQPAGGRLGEQRLGVPGDRVAYTPEDLEGTHTAGPIAAVQAAIRSGRLGEAGNALVFAAGAGITVALALYRQAPA
jgi:hypothetical protein